MEPIGSAVAQEFIRAGVADDGVVECRTDDVLDRSEAVGAGPRGGPGAQVDVDGRRSSVRGGVTTVSSQEEVIARAPDQNVGTVLAADGVVSPETHESIVSGQSDDDIVGFRALEEVVARRTDDGCRLAAAQRQCRRRGAARDDEQHPHHEIERDTGS
jgi:hypothetical protein